MKKRYLTILFALLFASVFTAFVLSNESKDFKLQKNLDIFYSLVRELNAFYVDDLKPDELFKESIDEMLNDLDPYTKYYPESERDDFTFMTTGKYGGIGSLIRQDDDYTVLTRIYKGFPADKAGLKAGDILKEIDGESLKGLDPGKVSDRLKGRSDTEVVLTLERQGKEFRKTLMRKRVAIPPVPYYGMTDNNTGYIRFTNFTQDCSSDVRNALTDLLDSNAEKIILDLRSNPGGLLNEAVEIVNLFMGPGHEVVSTRGKVEKYDNTYKTTRKAVDEDIPLAVLINSNTASASEIVAGAIQDYDRGVVVGLRSYGKGLVQISRPLSYNGTLKVTTAKYYIPSGRCIQALDFAHRNEDGSVGHIPDSLISEFTTKNGRIVKDGGGISPDYKVETTKLSQLSTQLYIRSVIFDFATEFFWNNPEIAQPGSFEINDKIYKDFIAFVKEQDFTYESATQNELERLKTIAKREKYYEKNSELFNELTLALNNDLENDLELFRDQISRLLEDEIMGRYFYEEGVIKHTLDADKQLQRAIKIINDTNAYASTLKGTAGLLTLKN
ncbi:MAG: S41 family peptidase [Bacteroidales bacterium]|nr:S41 family peptidase [Bacteroidales bacterium]